MTILVLVQVSAVDVLCEPGTVVHAPFAGIMEFWRPFGRTVEGCADVGVRIEGTGQWQGYVVQVREDLFCPVTM